MSCCSILEETGVWIKLGPPLVDLGTGKNMSACITIIFSKQCCATHPPAFWRGSITLIHEGWEVPTFPVPNWQFGFQGGSGCFQTLPQNDELFTAIGLISRSTTPQVFFSNGQKKESLGQKPGTSVADTKIAGIAGHRKWSNDVQWVFTHAHFCVFLPKGAPLQPLHQFLLVSPLLLVSPHLGRGEVRLGATTQDDAGH